MIAPDTRFPPGPVLGPLAFAALAEVAGWGLALGGEALGGAWYGVPALLVALHTLTLGVGATALVGASWQLVPVVSTRPWSPPALPWGLAILLGSFGLVLGFRGWPRVGDLGVGLLVLALGARSLLVIWTLARASGRRTLRAWLVASELCLLAGVGFGAALWAGRQGHPLLDDTLVGLGRHASLLLGGWLGGAIVGYGALLVPMFAVAAEPRVPGLGAVAGLLWFGGLAGGWPWVWSAGAVLAALPLLWTLLRGLKRGPAMIQVGLGCLGLLASAAVVPLAPPREAAGGLLLLFILPVIRGMSQRILPFFAHLHLGLDGPAPSPHPALGALQMLSSLAGALLVLGGWGSLGAAVALIGALGQLAVLAEMTLRLFLAHSRRGAIPGTEAS